jgi:hypothetical protein
MTVVRRQKSIALELACQNRKTARNLRYKKVEGKRIVRLYPRAHTNIARGEGRAIGSLKSFFRVVALQPLSRL